MIGKHLWLLYKTDAPNSLYHKDKESDQITLWKSNERFSQQKNIKTFF